MLTITTGCSNCGKKHDLNVRAWYRSLGEGVYQVQVDPVTCECGLEIELVELFGTDVLEYFEWYGQVEIERVRR
jgi:hypothetical protein